LLGAAALAGGNGQRDGGDDQRDRGDGLPDVGGAAARGDAVDARLEPVDADVDVGEQLLDEPLVPALRRRWCACWLARLDRANLEDRLVVLPVFGAASTIADPAAHPHLKETSRCLKQ
jgi:hypothetical protein